MKTKRTKTVTIKDEKKYVLRPRKKAPVQSPLVNCVVLSVEYRGRKHFHELYFTGTGLTVEEMFTRGFVGDVDLPGPNGEIIRTDVESGPVQEFSGKPVKELVFRFTRKDNGEPVDAIVYRFNYSTADPSR